MSVNETQIIFGLHSSIAAISNKNRNIKKIIMTEEVFKKNKQLFKNVNNIDRQIVDRKKIDSLIGEKVHQGIVVYSDKLPKKVISDIKNEEDLIIVLDSLNDSGFHS